MDPRMDITSDQGTEFPSSGVDQYPIGHTAVIFTVVPQIADDSPGTEIHPVADDTVAGIT